MDIAGPPRPTVIDRWRQDLPEHGHANVQPRGYDDAVLLHWNHALAATLGLPEPAGEHQADWLPVWAGTRHFPGAEPLATVYSGHQFGVWAGQLGDGRALRIADVCDVNGQGWELQLKGAGRTPFSRGADGRAVLRSSIREYLGSEAMQALGIPTTRALSLIGSQQPVIRETVETGAIVCRVAPSFVRFGHFEHWASRNDLPMLQALLEHVVRHQLPDCAATTPAETALRVFDAAIERSADLVARWQAVGFCHGVMNTDNMSLLGLTLDYGPFGFMDGFDANHICNHSDSHGRYRWAAQPSVVHWNLACLASALAPLLDGSDELRSHLARYEPAFRQAWVREARRKLGLRTEQAHDIDLFERLLGLMHAARADHTLTFRRLSGTALASAQVQHSEDLFADREAFRAWQAEWLARLRHEGSASEAGLLPETQARMDAANPMVVLRNHLAELAIRDTAAGSTAVLNRLHAALQNPFTETPEFADFHALPPDWATSLEVSCSS